MTGLRSDGMADAGMSMSMGMSMAFRCPAEACPGMHSAQH